MMIALGILCYIFFVPFLDQNTFLTKARTKYVLKRIEDDRGDSLPDPLTFTTVMQHLMDWKNWILGGKFYKMNCLSTLVLILLNIKAL
jgi:hypothetical protein